MVLSPSRTVSPFPAWISGISTVLAGYRYSKIAAEKAAWAFAETKPGFEVITINPPLVLGPNLQDYDGMDDLNQSSLTILNYMTGKVAKYPGGSMGFVAVEDVAKAHILVWEAAERASGRYLCSGASATWGDVCSTLRDVFGERARVPTECAAEGQQPLMTLDCTKLKELGMEFIDLRGMLQRQGESLLAKGLLS